jgi:hypothetical protein
LNINILNDGVSQAQTNEEEVAGSSSQTGWVR